MFHCDKQDIPKAKSHEINPRGIEIAEVDFVSPNKSIVSRCLSAQGSLKQFT
ncbi:hypothetical protein JHK86_018607 [Glycine max]|nr:hypothetical protein JHK86_018607 [Glycine max]